MPEGVNHQFFCLYELLSHTHFLYYSNNHIRNIFFHRKGNGGLLVLLYSYLHLHFVINTKTEEKVLEFVDTMYLHYKDSVNSNVYIFAKLYC